MGEECKGVGNLAHEPGAATRRGKQGRASVNGSPDRGGMQSLIGAIYTPRLLRYFSGGPKNPVYFYYSRC